MVFAAVIAPLIGVGPYGPLRKHDSFFPIVSTWALWAPTHWARLNMHSLVFGPDYHCRISWKHAFA